MNEQWLITDHICANCFGRVLKRAMPKSPVDVYRCSECGTLVESNEVTDICCCGLKLKSGEDMGLRCMRVDKPDSLPVPAEVIAQQVE